MNYLVKVGKEITIKELINIQKLDNSVYKKEYTLNLFKGFFWILKNKIGYICLIDKKTNSIIAYSSIISLKDKYYEQIKNGKLIDSKIPLYGLRSFSKTHINHTYFSSIVIDPMYQKTTTLLVLIKELQKQITNFYTNGIIIDKILCDAVSEKGVKLCEHFSLNKICSSNHNSTIYEGSLIPPSLKTNSELQEIIINTTKK